MQSGQDRLPTIEAPSPARATFARLGSNTAETTLAPNTQRLILDPLAQEGLSQFVQSIDMHERTSWVLAVGPESGFAPEEIEAAGRAGFKAIRMGPRILRAETAGLAAIAALQALCGDF
ncbi:MAG: RsmE family RNA methyltransferase [Betaproteobacteria bacterium]|nr:RsmE family RNA methyltransferase [Betaproteobacteria bacterium]